MYDNGPGMIAARIWWCLVYHGHPSPHVLEGGFSKWSSEGRGTEAAEPCPLKVYAQFEAQKNQSVYADAQDVLEAIEHGSVIIDARSSSQFIGKVGENDQMNAEARLGELSVLQVH